MIRAYMRNTGILSSCKMSLLKQNFSCDLNSERLLLCYGDADDFGPTDRISIVAMQHRLKKDLAIPSEVFVAHFTPSSFPIVPVMTKKYSALCNDAWQKVMHKEYISDSGEVTSGLVMFYNDFYERLGQVDVTGKIESVLSRNAGSGSKMAAKGEVLIRIINYVLLIDDDSKATQTLLYMLGVSHSQKRIRPWSYSVLVQTLLLSIAARLGKDANNSVMEAWVNVFAFIMKSMLPPAISTQIVPTEVHVNTSSDFAGGKIAEQVKYLEEEKIMKKKLGRLESSCGVSTSDQKNNHCSYSSFNFSPVNGNTIKNVVSTECEAVNISSDSPYC
eukprot:gene13141-27792_t